MPPFTPPVTAKIVSSLIHVTSYAAATEQIVSWAHRRESRYVCLANTHMLVEAHDSPVFREVLANADLACPDGMPVVWMQRALGFRRASRVRGADLMWSVCEAAAANGIPIGLYGGRPEVIDTLRSELPRRLPGLDIAFHWSPPFRPLRSDEDDAIVERLQRTGVRILFVGLGCPKQERWMAEHRQRIFAVMLGVGAAFDMHAGVVDQAPIWMRETGLEWAHRLFRDPGRLFRRYARNNPRFAFLALRQLLVASSFLTGAKRID